jgi:4-hydroxybenzoate polyprenyltransferase
MKKYINFIKFEHSIFALPFAFSGALLVKDKGLPEALTILWIVLAMVGGRSFAMAINRILDKEIDSKNPRTKNREIPSGEITNNQAIIFSIISLITFIYAALQLPKICLYLLPIAVIWFFIYPLTKKFTYLAHIWLGIALGGSVLGGFIATGGEVTSQLPYILGSAVAFWVAGFDIIYACQDYDFDKKNNLKSIPSVFGVKKALLISRVFHIFTFLLLLILGISINASFIYYLGVVFVLGMLMYEQSLVKENDLSKVDLAFFTLNGWVSVGFFVFLLIEKFF